MNNSILGGVGISRSRQNGRLGLLRHIVMRQGTHMCWLMYICMIPLALTMGGCSSDEVPVSTGQGKIQLTVSVDAQMRSADGSTFMPVQPIEVSLLSMFMSTADGTYSHTWESTDRFDVTQSFPSGTYKAGVYYDSPDDNKPSYYASAEFDVLSDQTTDVTLNATIKDAGVALAIGNHSAEVRPTGMWVRDGRDLMHYVDHIRGKFVADGNATLYPVVTNADASRSYVLDVSAVTDLSSATYYTYTISGDDNSLTLSGQGVNSRIATGADFWNAAAPSISSADIREGMVLTVSEGVPLEAPVIITATSERPMTRLLLSMNSASIYGSTDLLSATPDQILAEMQRHGFVYTMSADRRTVSMDFTRLIEQAPTLNAVYTHLSLMATDNRGVCSAPFMFDVDSKTVELSLESATPAVVGLDRSTVTLRTSTANVEEGDFAVRVSTQRGEEYCPISNWAVDASSGTVSFDIDLPAGVSPVDISVYYLGTPRVYATIERVAPQCTMDIDTYATTMYITFESPQGDGAAAAMASYASIYASGTKLSIWERYPEKHSVVVSGLTPGKRYNVSACLLGDTPATTATIITEVAQDLPQGNFEDVKTICEAKHLPCGGRYSTGEIPVVSRQNFTDIKIVWPEKHWAGVNAKTFSDACATPNTWYKMPSGNIVETLANDSRVICLTSVGWDLEGADIPDYIQQRGRYIPYNSNVPKVAHRSAGKLFLGSYTFDPKTLKETYNEGIPFHSRPSALNGFYKYLPDATTYDSGLIRVTIYGTDTDGKEIVIGRGEAQMHIAADMTAFNIPIHYGISGVKACRLCLMASSSIHMGDIEYEDTHVPTTAYPQKGAYIGSSLWLNSLYLSY